MPDHLIVTDEDATRVIKLRRPEKKNAISQQMYRAMSQLERVQRIRRGEAVPAPMTLEVSERS